LPSANEWPNRRVALSPYFAGEGARAARAMVNLRGQECPRYPGMLSRLNLVLSRQAFDSGEAVEACVEGQDLLDSVLFHDG
jgi:hypothetical protein